MAKARKVWFDTELLRAKVNNRRDVFGLSIRQAAEQIGVHHTTLIRLNTLNPDIQTTVQICDWLGEGIETFIRYHVEL